MELSSIEVFLYLTYRCWYLGTRIVLDQTTRSHSIYIQGTNWHRRLNQHPYLWRSLHCHRSNIPPSFEQFRQCPYQLWEYSGQSDKPKYWASNFILLQYGKLYSAGSWKNIQNIHEPFEWKQNIDVYLFSVNQIKMEEFCRMVPHWPEYWLWYPEHLNLPNDSRSINQH
jgi:hypothetical protein